MAFYLEFESEIKIIEKKINDLHEFSKEKEIDLSFEVDKLEKDLIEKLKEIYSQLSCWQKTLVARHPKRPFTLDYIELIVEDFVELHGDRALKDDAAIVGGLGKIGGQKFMIIGHQKGRDLQSNLFRNFGSSNPEGYRKALRLMKLAERFKIPVLTLIDTFGAYPGLEAEERGQGEAIARNLIEMAGLSVPIIAVVIGEGGSGGALALGVANKVFMMENSVYSVISPEGCASILFRDASKASEAADRLKISAQDLSEFGIIDEIIKEPIGGAHRDYEKTALNLKDSVLKTLKELNKLSEENLIEQRYQKFRNFGDFVENVENVEKLIDKEKIEIN